MSLSSMLRTTVMALSLVLVATGVGRASPYPVDGIPELIPDADAQKLKAGGVKTTQELLDKGATAKLRKELAKATAKVNEAKAKGGAKGDGASKSGNGRADKAEKAPKPSKKVEESPKLEAEAPKA